MTLRISLPLALLLALWCLAPLHAQISPDFVRADSFSLATLSAQKQAAAGPPGLAVAPYGNGPIETVLNINDFSLWVDTRGFFSWDLSSSGSAGEYPPETSVIFAEGILWGAKVRDGGEKLVRVNGSTYASGLRAGKVLYGPAGNVSGFDDPNTRHIWRVRRDYRTADLTADAASFTRVAWTKINDEWHADTIRVSTQELFYQYDYDWQYWPAAEGAPFEDVDRDGLFDPAVDVPGEPNALQTIWLVANDLPNADGSNVSDDFLLTPPIGIEMQMTLFATAVPAIEPLNSTILKRVKLIYTGLPDAPDTAHIDTMYISQWADPDVGDAGDDFVGFDRNLDMGFAYDAPTGLENPPPTHPYPAVGYVLLGGPKVAGAALRVSAFVNIPHDPLADPDLREKAPEYFNMMEGFLPRPQYPEQDPFISPITGDPVKFTHDGDPVAGTGWIDGMLLPPGDRQFLMTTGPFAMALGDTQEVLLALVAALSTDPLASIVKLRYFAVVAQLYNADGLPAVDVSGPQITYSPERYVLSANYPNPFNPITRIDYQVPVVSILTLGVYNLLGQEIIRLVEQRAHPPGNFSVVWNGHSWNGQLVPAGVYFYRLEALPPYVLPGQGIVMTGKMVLLK